MCREKYLVRPEQQNLMFPHTGMGTLLPKTPARSVLLQSVFLALSRSSRNHPRAPLRPKSVMPSVEVLRGQTKYHD